MRTISRALIVFSLLLLAVVPAGATCEICELDGERGVCRGNSTPAPSQETFSNCQGGSTCAYIPTPFGTIRICWPSCSGDLCLWV